MKPGKAINNVNVLDLRKATEASVAEISHIDNVNVILYSPETVGLIKSIQIGNLNTSVEVPSEVKPQTVTGQTIINRDFFTNLPAPIFLLTIGQVIVEPGVTAEQVEKGLRGLIAIGQILCPEQLLGVFQAKAYAVIGQAKTFPGLKQVKIGSLEMDETSLQALEDQAELAVIGSLTLPQVLPNDLLEKKIHKLFVSDQIVCHQENAQVLQSRLVDGARPIKIIPAGYEWVGRPLVLDRDLLETLSTQKLYCTERVQVEASVTPAELNEHLDAILCEGMLLCPQNLKTVLARKCDLLKTHVLFYEGELWLSDGEDQLRSSRFDYLEGKATLVVDGALTLEPGIEPKLLADRLARVHNFGLIRCTPQQMGAIQARLGTNEGMIQDSTRPEEAEAGENQIGNANYLVL